MAGIEVRNKTKNTPRAVHRSRRPNRCLAQTASHGSGGAWGISRYGESLTPQVYASPVPAQRSEKSRIDHYPTSQSAPSLSQPPSSTSQTPPSIAIPPPSTSKRFHSSAYPPPSKSMGSPSMSLGVASTSYAAQRRIVSAPYRFRCAAIDIEAGAIDVDTDSLADRPETLRR